jgi:serine/threonine protein kinase
MAEFNISGFKIIEKIGEGGMATVWKANQKSLDRLVAIKVLSPKLAANKEDIDLFRQEAQSAAKLKHPGIIQVYDARTDEGLYSLVMEFIDGYTVGDWQRRTTILEESNVILISESVAMALEYAWDTNKIIHCDIKPDNVMIDADGTVKLADLGLSRTISNLDAAQDLEEVMGTPAYMSPEQVQGDTSIDCRSDIYSLGAMMYHLCTGKMLFEGYSEEQVMEMQLYETPPSVKSLNNEISQGMSDLIALMLKKEAEKRPKDWRVVIKKLQDVKAGKSIISKKILTDPSFRRKVSDTPKKIIAVKHTPNNINSSFNNPIAEVEKKKSSVGVTITLAILFIVVIAGFGFGINKSNKNQKQQAIEAQQRAAYNTLLQKEQKIYEAILTYHKNNPYRFGYVISKLNDLNKKAQTNTYKELSAEKIKTLQKQYDKAVKTDIGNLDWQSSKYIEQKDLFKAQYIYTGYHGHFTDETKAHRDEQSKRIQKLLDQKVVEAKQKQVANISTKTVVQGTLKRLTTSTPASAQSFLDQQIKKYPELVDNSTIIQLNKTLALFDTKAVIMESYTKLKKANAPITLKTKNSDMSVIIKSIEDDGLNVNRFNSDGIVHTSAFVPYSQLSKEEIEDRLRENQDAYNISKGLEYTKNKSYNMAEVYFKSLSKNHSKLMLYIINKSAKQAYNVKAEEDLTKIFRAFNIEIYSLEELNSTEPPSLSAEQVQSLKQAIKIWQDEYVNNTLNFQFTAE